MSRRRIPKFRGPRGFQTSDPENPGPAPEPPPPPKKTRKQPQPWTQERKEAFCAELRKHGRPGAAARAVGASKRNVIRKREQDPEFDQLCLEAWEDFRESTIANVQKHAWEGVQEPVFHGEKIVGVRTKYNTKMMELEARRVVPEYRDNKAIELSGKGGGPIETRTKVDLQKLPTERLELLEEILSEADPSEQGGPEGESET